MTRYQMQILARAYLFAAAFAAAFALTLIAMQGHPAPAKPPAPHYRVVVTAIV